MTSKPTIATWHIENLLSCWVGGMSLWHQWKKRFMWSKTTTWFVGKHDDIKPLISGSISGGFGVDSLFSQPLLRGRDICSLQTHNPPTFHHAPWLEDLFQDQVHGLNRSTLGCPKRSKARQGRTPQAPVSDTVDAIFGKLCFNLRARATSIPVEAKSAAEVWSPLLTLSAATPLFPVWWTRHPKLTVQLMDASDLEHRVLCLSLAWPYELFTHLWMVSCTQALAWHH